MSESNGDPRPPVSNQASASDRLAREMVRFLDTILGRLVEVAPAEGAEGVPLTLQEVRVIKAIAARESVTMSALASSMRISLPTATHLVDRLVTKGIVVRTRPEHDRRLVLVTLSERSKAHEHAFFENRVALILSIFEPLDLAEREQVVRALGEIARAVESRVASQALPIDPQ